MKNKRRDNAITCLYIAIGMLLAVSAANTGIDKSIAGKQQMLCQSAKVSGNTNYNC